MPDSYNGAVQLTRIAGGGSGPVTPVTVSGGNNIAVVLAGSDYQVSLRRDQPIQLDNAVPFQGTTADGTTAVDLASVGVDDRLKLGDPSAAFDVDVFAATQVVLPNAVALAGYDTGGVARALAQLDGGDVAAFGGVATEARLSYATAVEFQAAGVLGARLLSPPGFGTTLNVGAAAANFPLATSVAGGVTTAGAYYGYVGIPFASPGHYQLLAIDVTGGGTTISGYLIGDAALNVPTRLTGGLAPQRLATAISTTASPDDTTFVAVTSTAAPRTITVGPGGYPGALIGVADESGGAGTNAITIVGTGVSITFDGAVSATINANYGARLYEWDGAGYHSIASANLAAAAVTVASGNGVSATGGPAYTVALAFAGQAQGDLIYRDAAAWARLPASTAGFVLTTGGAGANPAWAALPSSVPTARTLATTAPVRIDGGASADLSANRTLSLDYDATRFALVGTTLRPQLANNVSLQGLTTGAVATNLLSLDNANFTIVGAASTAAVAIYGGSASRSFLSIAGFVHSLDINAGISVASNGSTVVAPPAGIGVANQSVGGSYAAAGYFGRNAANGAWLQGLGWGASDVLTLGNAAGRTALGGGWTARRTPTAVSYVVLASDHCVGVTSTAAARTVTLPASPPAGTQYVVADESGGAGTNNITVLATTSTLNGIAGATGIPIGANFGAWIFTSDGTNYTGQPWLDPSVLAVAKPAARVVARSNVAALTGANTTDGVVLATGDVILLTAQSAPANNGPWRVNTAGAWTRPFWFATSAMALPYHTIGVLEGTANARSGWFLANTTPPTLGSTALTYDGRTPTYGVIATDDSTELLTWRRSSAGTRSRLFNADGSGNLVIGDTAGQAATLLAGNGDIRITTTYNAANNQANIGVSNTQVIINMASGVSAIDTIQIRNTPEVIWGQRENTSGSAPVLLPTRGAQPHTSASNAAASGLQFSTGASRGTAEATITLVGYDPVGSGSTLQSVLRTVLTARGRYLTFGTGVAYTPRTVAGTTATAAITDNLIRCTNAVACVVTLPAGNTLPNGWTLLVSDVGTGGAGSGAVSVAPTGADTLNGAVVPIGGGRILMVVADGVSDFQVGLML